jgi:hypothetical protein
MFNIFKLLRSKIQFKGDFGFAMKRMLIFCRENRLLVIIMIGLLVLFLTMFIKVAP